MARDRKDGKLLKDMNPDHVILANLNPSRCKNEAVANIEIDVTNLDKFLEEKNAQGHGYKYTYMQVVLAAMAKVFEQRPKLNQFVAKGRFYQRNIIRFAFVAKRYFADDASSVLLFFDYDENYKGSILNQVRESICPKIYRLKEDKEAKEVDNPLDFVTKMPQWLMSIVAWGAKKLDKRGIMPNSMVELDPLYSSCFFSNLGSIDMNASYHHLADWGTNSFFFLIGKKEYKPVFSKDGSYEMKPLLPIGLTIDERIADGIYFNNSIKLLINYLQNPHLLEG